MENVPFLYGKESVNSANCSVVLVARVSEEFMYVISCEFAVAESCPLFAREEGTAFGYCRPCWSQQQYLLRISF